MLGKKNCLYIPAEHASLASQASWLIPLCLQLLQLPPVTSSLAWQFIIQVLVGICAFFPKFPLGNCKFAWASQIYPSQNVSSPRRLASDIGTWLENSTSPLETSRYIMQNNYYAKKLLWMSGVTFLVWFIKKNELMLLPGNVVESSLGLPFPGSH